MANYYGTTTSEGGKVAKKNIAKVQELIDTYEFGNEGELNVIVGDNLEIYGYDQLYARIRKDEDAEETDEDYDDKFEEFLTAVAPFVDTDFVVNEVGNEKCRYINAYAYVIHDHKVKYTSLDIAVSTLIRNWNNEIK